MTYCDVATEGCSNIDPLYHCTNPSVRKIIKLSVSNIVLNYHFIPNNPEKLHFCSLVFCFFYYSIRIYSIEHVCWCYMYGDGRKHEYNE